MKCQRKMRPIIRGQRGMALPPEIKNYTAISTVIQEPLLVRGCDEMFGYEFTLEYAFLL